MNEKQVSLTSQVCQDEIKLTEFTTLKASFEYLKKRHRGNQKGLENDFKTMVKSIDEFKKGNESERCKSEIIEEFCNLKRKAETIVTEELNYTKACKLRLNHLLNLSENKSIGGVCVDELDVGRDYVLSRHRESQTSDSKVRFQRHVADHLFARGLCETALKLGQSIDYMEMSENGNGTSPDSNCMSLVEVYKETLNIMDSLKSGDTSLAEAWLTSALSKQKKSEMKHSFPTDLQIFKIYLLIKQGEYETAIKYARSVSDPTNVSESHLEKLAKVMSLMIFRSQDELSQKAVEWEVDETWIISQFHSCVLQFYSFYNDPTLLSLIVNTGISVHKTDDCYRKDTKKQHCVVCNEPVNGISTHVPAAIHDQTVLICWKTGLRMNESNEPLAFPNGYVYSTHAINQLKEGDTVVCPRSNLRCKISELHKVFVV